MPEMADTETAKEDHARSNARGHAETIAEGIAAMHKADENHGEPVEFDGNTYKGRDAADEIRQALEQEALSVEVRAGWHTPGTDAKPDEFNVLLTTGGPALRLLGDLNEYGEPENARLEYQDWFTPWTKYEEATEEQETALLEFARLFYFGE